MTVEPDIAETAALFGDPVRAAMLTALLDQTALSAGQRAFAANSQSGIPARGAEVANVIESLAAISASRKPVPLAEGRFRSERLRQLRMARTCYDHLAGVTGVLLLDSFLQSGYLIASTAKEYVVTEKGFDWLRALGANANITRTRSPFARACLDWSERRPHLAGRLATQLLDLFLKDGWIVRIEATRAVRITERGLREFDRQYGLKLKSAI